VRQHQSAFVPLGPQVEKDVPKRLIQLVRTLFPEPLIFLIEKRPIDIYALPNLGERAHSVLRPL
jgi:hypothetical protein